jgi:two-component system, OmpR family, response regulator
MNKHILLIDDEADIRDLLARFLVSRGYRVTSHGLAAEAEATVKRDPPDLIISDLQLEDEDGLEMIANMKKGLPDVPVILLTGVLFDPRVVRDNLSKKVSCYLEKTSSLAKILEAIRRLLGQ